MARFDLLKRVRLLAKRITRWNLECDRRLHRLIGYVAKTADDISSGWIGDSLRDLTAHLFADASLADCPYTLNQDAFFILMCKGLIPDSRYLLVVTRRLALPPAVLPLKSLLEMTG